MERQDPRICKVKVQVRSDIREPRLHLSFASSNKACNVKFVAPNAQELYGLLEEAKRSVILRGSWAVEWNWKGSSDIVRKESRFVHQVETIFGTDEEEIVYEHPMRGFTPHPVVNHDSDAGFGGAAPMRGFTPHPVVNHDSDSHSEKYKSNIKKAFPPPPIHLPGGTLNGLIAPPRRLRSEDIVHTQYVRQLVAHCKQYGSYPDFTDMSMKGRKKTVNYLRSALASPRMSEEEALDIAAQAMEQLN